MSNAFHKHEDITGASLKVSVPDLPKSHREIWKSMVEDGAVSTPRFRYDIFFVDDGKIGDFKQEILRLLQNTDLGFHQTPLITKSFDVKFGNVTQENSIDVIALAKKWRENYLMRRTKKFQSAFLRITTKSNFFTAQQCIPFITSIPKLIMTTHDYRQCPLPTSSYQKREDANTVASDAKTRVKRSPILNGSTAGLRRAPNQPPPLEDLELDVTRPKSGGPEHTSLSRSVRSTICKRHLMFLRFDDVGWGQWIIAPRGIQAYKCAGDCPFPLVGRLGGNNHALLLNLMSAFDSRNHPAASCIPSSLSPLPLLYFDKNGVVVLRQYEEMVVQSCACR